VSPQAIEVIRDWQPLRGLHHGKRWRYFRRPGCNWLYGNSPNVSHNRSCRFLCLGPRCGPFPSQTFDFFLHGDAFQRVGVSIETEQEFNRPASHITYSQPCRIPGRESAPAQLLFYIKEQENRLQIERSVNVIKPWGHWQFPANEVLEPPVKSEFVAGRTALADVIIPRCVQAFFLGDRSAWHCHTGGM